MLAMLAAQQRNPTEAPQQQWISQLSMFLLGMNEL